MLMETTTKTGHEHSLDVPSTLSVVWLKILELIPVAFEMCAQKVKGKLGESYSDRNLKD